MANDIYFDAVTGLTPLAQLYQGASTVGSPISLIEIGTTGIYVGNVPNGIPFGSYIVLVYSGDHKFGANQLDWSSQYEIPIAEAKINGFDKNNPCENTPTSRTSGDLVLDVDGYGSALTTITNST